MADDVVGSAYVEIKPKLDGFQRELARDARGRFVSLERAAEQAGEAIENSMQESARQSNSWLDRIGGADVWSEVKSQASRAGEAITGHFREAARQSEAALDSVQAGGGSRLLGFVGTLGAALAGVGLGRGIAESVGLAADLGESINAINVVLGDSAASFLEFGSTSAQQLGLTQSALNESIVPMAALLKNAGVEGDALSGQLAQLAQAATDTGSVLNKDTTEVLNAFGAALRGEAEPARALGVSFNDAQVQAKALALGLADAEGNVNEAAKTQARLALVIEQTTQFAGDFQNTAESLPNTLKRLRASAAEAAAGFGSALLPAVAEAANGLNDLLLEIGPQLNELGGAVAENLVPLFDALGPSVGVLLETVTSLVGTFGETLAGLAPLIEPIVGAMRLFADVVGQLVSAGLAALAPVIEVVVDAANDLLPVLADLATEVLADLAPILAEIGELLADGLADILPIIAGAFLDILAAVRPLLPVLLGLVRDGLAVLIPIIQQIVEVAAPLVTQVFAALTPIIERLAPLLSGVLAQVLPVIAEAFLSILNALAPVIPLLADGLMSVIEALAPVLPSLGESFGRIALALADLLIALMPLIEPLIQLVVLITDEALAPAITLIAEALALLAEALAWVVEQVVGFVTDVIGWFQELYDTLVGNSIIPDLINDIVSWFTGLPGAVLGIIAGLVTDLIAAFVDLALDVVAKVRDLASDLLGVFGGIKDDSISTVTGLVDEIVSFFTELPGRVVDGISNIGSKIAGVFTSAFDTATSAALNIVDEIVSFFTELPGRILGTLGGIGSDIADGLFNAVKSAWNSIVDRMPTISVPIPFVDDPKVDIGSYLRLANGAILNGPTLMMGGEAGREAVIPLTRPRRAMELADQSGLTDMILDARGGGGPVVQFNGGQVFQDATDADVVAQRVTLSLLVGRAA